MFSHLGDTVYFQGKPMNYVKPYGEKAEQVPHKVYCNWGKNQQNILCFQTNNQEMNEAAILAWILVLIVLFALYLVE
jgi:hypothetical protein